MNLRMLLLVVLVLVGAFVAWEVARPQAAWVPVDREEVRELSSAALLPEAGELTVLSEPAAEEPDLERILAGDPDRIDYPAKVEGERTTPEEPEELTEVEEEEAEQGLGSFEPEDFRVETSWVRGRLLAERGGFEISALALNKGIVVELSSRETPTLSMQADLEFTMETDGTRSIAFSFEEVPLGAYELSVSSLGNHRWGPSERQVYPPEEGLEFMRYDLDETGAVNFLVTDAETGEPVSDYRLRTVRATHSQENGVFLHTGPLDARSIPVQGSVDWTIDATGYAPAFGDESSFQFVGEKRICRVVLVPGWATRFLVLGSEERSSDGGPVTVPLQGAAISIDGQVVGLTGADGTLVCQRGKEPSEIEVRHGELVVRGDPAGVVEGRSASQRGNVSVVLMTRPEGD